MYNESMNTTTSEKILHYLSIHPLATAHTLSLELNLTHADIRYHLNILLKKGWVEVNSTENSGRRGKPSRVYGLTGATPNLPQISLLENLLKQLSPSSDTIYLKRFVKEYFQRSSEDPSSSSFSLILLHGIEKLKSLGYDSSWEARPNAPIILIRHCPYGRLAVNYPVLCEIDRQGLEHLTRHAIQLDNSMGLTGNCPCVFQVLSKPIKD